jgi:hypothetical protein
MVKRWLLAVGMTAALATPAVGESLFKETFEDGRDGWYLTSGGTISVADDGAGIGSGKALFLSVDAGSTQRRLVANFRPVELSNAGDGIVLRFAFRITGSSAAARGGGDALLGFRFGLFDSRGTPQTTDSISKAASANATDDVGYLAMVSVGVHNRAHLAEERAEDGHLMGGPDLYYHHTADDFGGINDSAKHTAILTIRRASSAVMRLELLVDGKRSMSGDVTGALRTRFDELGFAGSNNACNFVIDNVEVAAGTPPAESRTPSVRGRCEPCAIEVGKTTTVTAAAQGGNGFTYKWSAPTGTFGDPTAPQTTWRAPMRRAWTEERWRKEGAVPIAITVTLDDGRGGSASDTVAVRVIRASVK